VGRRRKDSLVENILTVGSKLSWPVGVALAIATFIVFGLIAGIDPPTVTNAGNVTAPVVHAVITTGATFFQWLISGLLLFGSAFSAWKQRRSIKLFKDVAASRSAGTLTAMTWKEFERLVGAYFRRRGFEVQELGGGAPDGGVDLIARRGTDEYVIQCKQWKALQVGVVTARELYGVVSARRAAGGFLVTSGSFTEEARRFASGLSIELIDGALLTAEIVKQRRGEEEMQLSASRESRVSDAPMACPYCGSEMIMRTARKGSSAGRRFSGCSQFPSCRGTRAAE
jgi:restriction system protein